MGNYVPLGNKSTKVIDARVLGVKPAALLKLPSKNGKRITSGGADSRA